MICQNMDHLPTIQHKNINRRKPYRKTFRLPPGVALQTNPVPSPGSELYKVINSLSVRLLHQHLALGDQIQWHLISVCFAERLQLWLNITHTKARSPFGVKILREQMKN
nr:hypothetical 12.6K protein - Marek's disease virus [Gallid alphaherpesvirus 2]